MFLASLSSVLWDDPATDRPVFTCFACLPRGYSGILCVSLSGKELATWKIRHKEESTMSRVSQEGAVSVPRRRAFVDKIAIVIIAAIFVPLLVADIFVFRQLRTIRAHLDSTMRTFGDETRSELNSMLREDLVLYLTEAARQGSQGADEFFKDAAEVTNSVSGLMTTVYSYPENYSSRSIAEPEPDRRDLSVQLILPPRGKTHAELSAEIGLAANIQDVLYQVKTSRPIVGVVSVASDSGFSIEADTYAYRKFSQREHDNYDARQRPWYISAKLKNELTFSDIYQNYYTRENSISASMPFYAKGKFAGVVAISCSLVDLNRQVEELRLTEGSFAFVVDRAGRVVASPRREGELRPFWIGEETTNLRRSSNRALSALAERMCSGGQGAERVVIDEHEFFLAFNSLSMIDWSYALAVPVSTALRPTHAIMGTLAKLKTRAQSYMQGQWNKTLLLLSVLHLLLALLSLVVAHILARRLTRPLGELSSWAGLLSQGRLEQPIALQTGDEIETLAETFNSMRINLSAHMEQLAESRAARERLLAELDVARDMQQGLLPHLPHGGFPGVDLAASMTPAKLVGGDFYDFFLLDDNHLAVVMGDVSDKGVPAALYMAMIKTMIKGQSASESSPARVLELVNNTFSQDNEAFMFATVFMGVLSLLDGEFVYANAGHCDPLCVLGQGNFSMLGVPPGLVLGVEPGVVYEERRIRFEPGGTLLLYTDGVTEAVDAGRTLYSEKRLLEFANTGFGKTRSALGMIDMVEAEVFQFSRNVEQADDLTLLALRREKEGERIRLPAAIPALERLTAFIEGHLSSCGCPADEQARLQLVCEEIFVNIVNHAYQASAQDAGADEGAVIVSCRVCPGEANFEFRDQGEAFDPVKAEAPDITQSPDERSIGGLGLELVRQFTDEVRYRRVSNENILLICKKWHNEIEG